MAEDLKLRDEDLAKILFLGTEPEVSNNAYNEQMQQTKPINNPIDRLIKKFVDALTQERMTPIRKEVHVTFLKLGRYSISEPEDFTLESNFSDESDVLLEGEEDILEFTEILQLLGYEVPTRLKNCFDHIIKRKKIAIRQKAGDTSFNKTFFVYAENKILMEICDSLTTNDVYSLYSFLRDYKGQKYEKEIDALASAISINFSEEALIKVPGLKDVAFYLLILSMMQRQIYNRLYTHALEYLLKEVIKMNTTKGTTDNNPKLEAAINKLQMYPVASRPPGLCIIFTMLEDREGAQEDKTAVKLLFRDQFHYDVLCIDNPNSDRIKSVVTKLSAQKNKFYDSLIVIFMGHGTETHLEVDRGRIQRRRDFIEPFTKIKWLTKKPKLFFIQACAVREQKRSSKNGSSGLGGMDSQVDSTSFGTNVGEDWQDKFGEHTDMSFTNVFADTLISNATMWSQEASRSAHGSLYIHTLIDKLQDYGCKESVENVLRRVHYYVNLVALNHKNKLWKQAPYFESSLQKQFIFPKVA